jgi:hypothetical protein
VVSSALHWGLVLKKKLNLQGVRPPPEHYCDRDDLLTQAEKNPRTLPHPDTGTIAL